MRNGDKSRNARQALENLFSDLPPSSAQSKPGKQNPFEDAERAARVDARPSGDGTIWKESVVSFPVAVEVPRGYESAAHVHEAMERAWKLRWHRKTKDELVTELAPGWGAVKLPDGSTEVRDSNGLPRAVFGWSEHAELRLLTRYTITSREGADGRYQVVAYDRQRNSVLERSLFSAQSGTSHPEWARLMGWLAKLFPQHQDPLRYWDDCEAARS
ncbi:hypothetical protein [Paraburkholderia sp.]|uniref:hypothetical protein n=1 Tax=Paraburkholderia sp. TaxID=1926495 RepID=UPI0023A4F0BE|nr:hypothetical protein [Paraburkholderia sp.]MDE1183016.1 hypothetical protein [Paraburkholderia sp.]